MSRKYKFHYLEGLVYKPEDYFYCSTRDYSGEKGLLDDVIVAKYHHTIQSCGSWGKWKIERLIFNHFSFQSFNH